MSLYEMNAQARLPSGLRYLARFSSTLSDIIGAGTGDGRGEGLAGLGVFFGELKKLNLDLVGEVTLLEGRGTGCRAGWELVFIWATTVDPG